MNFIQITAKTRNEALIAHLYPKKPNRKTGELEDFPLEDYLDIGLPFHAGLDESDNPEIFIRSVDQSPDTRELRERYHQARILFDKTGKFPSQTFDYWEDRLNQAVNWALKRLQRPWQFANDSKNYERWRTAPNAQKTEGNIT